MRLLFHVRLEEKGTFADFGGQSSRTGIEFAAIHPPHRCCCGFSVVRGSHICLGCGCALLFFRTSTASQNRKESFEMKRLITISSGLCLAVGCIGVAAAQEVPGPPKVLVIQREYLKPGRAGSVHEKSESAFVRAMTAAKWPTHYFAVESMSGPSRALFLLGYPSFAAWEKDNEAQDKNATLAAAFSHAALADGDLLTSFDQGVFLFREDMSLRPNADIPHSRYFEISSYKV
jgi:hypothetical protein